MKTVEEAQCGGGPRRWRCSEERRAALMCPSSRGRIGGEEGHGQSRVEGLGVALIGGGGRWRFKPAQLAPVPGRWTTGGNGGRWEAQGREAAWHAEVEEEKGKGGGGSAQCRLKEKRKGGPGGRHILKISNKIRT
jgi:hypothetical protein